ncbi:MAG: glycosyltransferase family 9 protein [Bacteroidales bacterium]|jgi:heptosyltransferase-2
MSKILIIKTAATGDVVRTTTLLHCFKNDQVWWITAKINIDVLPNKISCLERIITIEDISSFNYFEDIFFDIVLSLDDDKESIDIVDKIKYKNLIGAYRDKVTNRITYTSDSAHWFDLSLISHYSKQEADSMKFNCKMSVQEHLFNMIGERFNGEEYLIYEGIKPNPDKKLIGIEARAGDRWPTKRWNGYEELAFRLEKEGFNVVFFKQRNNIRDYMKDISLCSYVICGDTLAMHLALAYKIPVLTIFTCTSAAEIFDYSRMEKVVSPYLQEAFFKTTYIPKAVDSITQEMVWDAFERNIRL